MKKRFLPLIICALLTQFSNAQKLDYETKKWYVPNADKNYHTDNVPNAEEFSKPQTDEPVTLDMLNAPKGVYRTYEDFINKKAEPLIFLSTGHGHAGSKLLVKELTFEGSDKKDVKIKPEEIWGFVDVYGNLNRMAKYFSKYGTFYIPYTVEYVSDYIMYHPNNGYTIDLRPWQWCSKDLKSPIVEATYYFQHNKNKHIEVSNCQNECEKKAPKLYSAWTLKIEECELTCPGIKFVYCWSKKNEDCKYKQGAMQ
jgi:hypothetical protein